MFWKVAFIVTWSFRKRQDKTFTPWMLMYKYCNSAETEGF